MASTRALALGTGMPQCIKRACFDVHDETASRQIALAGEAHM